MKSILNIFGLFLLSIFILSSCGDKDNYFFEEETGAEDLVVPSGFDWKMTEDISLVITSSVSTQVGIYLSEKCISDEMIADIFVSGVDNVPVAFSVPKGTTHLYVQYIKKDGTKGVTSVTISTITRNNQLEVKLPEDVGVSTDNGKTFYYPSSGKLGTILFEDNWPVKGDYDFNDLVAQYQLRTESDKNGGCNIDIWMRIAALGGDRPYRICLMLDGIPTSELVNFRVGESLAKIELLSKGQEDILFSFDWENLKGLYGGRFYNTEYTVPVVDYQKQVAYFTIYVKDKSKVDYNAFNFFIQDKENSNEIHMMGYKPTSDFLSRYNELTEENASILNQDIYYRHVAGFVWGLKIPDEIAHTREGIDFCKGYKYFSSWVQSGGKEYSDWYKSGDNSKLMPLIK